MTTRRSAASSPDSRGRAVLADAFKHGQIAWKPLPGSQVLALSCPANHILFEGTRGPGKTDTQIVRFAKRCNMGYGRFWRGILFDREYKNLDDIINKSLRWFSEFAPEASFSGGGGGGRWRWPGGEELLLRHMKRPVDYYKYHGHEYPSIGWNELTKYPTSELYDTMMSCNRTSFRPEDHPVTIDGDIYKETGQIVLVNEDDDAAMEHILPPIPLEVFSTTNPFGPGHNWVKRRFIDPAEPGQIVRKVVSVFNPRTKQREDVTRTQVRIFGSYKENIYLPPEYIAELESMTDENKRKAWLWGDWDVVSGGAFDDVWSPKIVVPRFKIPKGWYLDRSFDWGSTHPFAVQWWAVANGEEVVLPDGRKFAPRKGSLILFHEWYGTKELGTNAGLKMSSPEIAQEIVRQEAAMRKQGWYEGTVQPGPADNQIGDTRESDVETIKRKMEKYGVHWTASDKSAGSRKIGLQLVRDRMEAVRDDLEEPGVYAMDHCRAFITTIPILPRDEDDPDDVDSAAEDHPYDAFRYRALAAPRIARRRALKH